MTEDDQHDPDVLLGRAAAIDDLDADARWEIVSELHRRTDPAAFAAACTAARSVSLNERVLGLDILGQIGYSARRPFLEATLPLLIEACDDRRSVVLEAAISALGHVADTRGLASVLRHAAHPSADVRFAVAAAVPLLAGDPPAEEAVAALIRLSGDEDPEIRDWATMGLGSQLQVDSRQIRDALAERLTDEEGDTAGEALLGLARRRDPRALQQLLTRLEDDPGNLIVEAAAALGAPEALQALQRLREEGWEDGTVSTLLDEAIIACS